jgi:hypothetical protein
VTLLVGYTPAQYAIMASDLPLAWRSRRGRYRDRQRTRRQPAIVIQVHEGTLGHKGVLFLGRGDRRVVTRPARVPRRSVVAGRTQPLWTCTSW